MLSVEFLSTGTAIFNFLANDQNISKIKLQYLSFPIIFQQTA